MKNGLVQFGRMDESTRHVCVKCFIHRRATHLPNCNRLTIDKDQLRHLEEIREKGLPDKGRESVLAMPSPVGPGSAIGNQEKTRKLPIWQQVAQEKSTVFQNKK